jgi:hypothetical protein
MIRIRVNKIYELHLDADTSITFVFNNPLFNYENVEGDYTYPFTIPAIPENQLFIGVLHKLEQSFSSIPSFNIELWIDNVGPLMGTMDIDGDVTEQSYEATVFLGKGEFMYLTKNKKLNTVDLGGEQTLSDIADLTTLIQQTYPLTKFQVFPVYNPDYFKDVFSSDGGTDGKPVYYDPLSDYMNDFTTNASIASARFKQTDNPFVLFPYLTYVIEQIFKQHGYTIEKNIFNDIDELKSLCIFNTYGNNKISKEYTEKYKYIIDVTDISPDYDTSFILNWGTNSYTYTAKHWYQGNFPANQFPTRYPGENDGNYANDFFNAFNNYLIDGDYNLSLISTYIIIEAKEYGNYALNLIDDGTGFTLQADPDNPSESDVRIYYNLTYNLINSMPDMTIQEFMQAIKNLFNIDYDINNRSVSIISADDKLNSKDIEDISSNTESIYIINYQKQNKLTFKQTTDTDDSAFVTKDFDGVTIGEDVQYTAYLNNIPKVINQVRRVVSTDTYYICIVEDFNTGPTWVNYQQWYKDYVIGEGEDLTIETACSSLQMDRAIMNTSPDEYVLTPGALQKGKMNILGDVMTDSKSGLRLLFYRGLRTSNLSKQYPYAGYDDRDENYNVVWNYSLKWDGANGLINKFWIKTIYWINRRKQLTLQKKYNAVEMFNLNLMQKKRVFGNTVFIKQVTVSVNNNGIEPAKVEAWTV